MEISSAKTTMRAKVTKLMSPKRRTVSNASIFCGRASLFRRGHGELRPGGSLRRGTSFFNDRAGQIKLAIRNGFPVVEKSRSPGPDERYWLLKKRRGSGPAVRSENLHSIIISGCVPLNPDAPSVIMRRTIMPHKGGLPGRTPNNLAPSTSEHPLKRTDGQNTSTMKRPGG